MSMLTEGAEGQAVKNLQRALREMGFTVSVDGVFGVATKVALMAWQKKFGRVPTGIIETDSLLLPNVGPRRKENTLW